MSKYISRQLLEEYLQYIGIQAVVERYSAESKPLRGRNNIMLYLCPFHPDTRLGAAQAYLDKNDCYCNACGAGGGVQKLTYQFAKNTHPSHANDFNALLEDIVEDLGIPRSSVVEDGDWKKDRKLETVDETVYIELFGAPYLTMEKKFAVVPMPQGKSLRVPTEVEKIYFKSLFMRDRKLHDVIVIKRAREMFRKEIASMNIEEAKAFSEKQIGLLKKIFKAALPNDEQSFRQSLLTRKEVLDAFIAKHKN